MKHYVISRIFPDGSRLYWRFPDWIIEKSKATIFSNPIPLLPDLCMSWEPLDSACDSDEEESVFE